MINAVKDHAGDLDAAAQLIAREAFDRGSDDNLTTLVVRVDALPTQDANEVHRQLTELPFPPELVPRMNFDGFTILRELHVSSRSHVYLASFEESPVPVVIKTLSTELRADVAQLERFLMEDWVAQRISNPHVLKAAARGRRRNFLYTVTEFVDGQTLHQWLIDNPKPAVETVRRRDRADRQRPHGVSPARDAAPGPASAERHDRRQRHGEDHRLRRDASGGNFGDRFAAGAQRTVGHDAVHRAGIFPRRERHAAFGSVFAGSHRLPDVVRPAAIRRRGSEGADACGAAAS